MKAKLSVLALAAAGAMGMTIAANANAAVLYGFNDGVDGWTGKSGAIVGVQPDVGTTPNSRGVTEGTGALVLAAPINSWDNPRLASPVETGSVLAGLAGQSELFVDVTAYADNIGLNNGTQNFIFSIYLSGKDASGNTIAETKLTRLSSTGASGGTVASTDARFGSDQATFSFDYSNVGGGAFTNGTAQEVQFRITLGTAGGLSVSGERAWVVFDNIHVVPEPASLSILGLGGLALLTRRRRQV